MTLKEFYDKLEKHDWWYCMSDDGKVYERGSQNFEKLKKIANESTEHMTLYMQYSNYVDSLVNGPKLPKPERPVEDK